jgi:hypothetical protein
LFVPSKKEYHQRASKVLGMAPLKSKGFCHDIKSSVQTIRKFWTDHVCFVLAMTGCITLVNVYPVFVGTYIQMLWGSQKAGDDYAATVTQAYTVVGIPVACVASVLSDSLGDKGFYILCLGISGLFVAYVVNIMGTTYAHQITCTILMASFQCLFLPATMKYCLKYSPPTQLGTFNGLVWTFTMILFTAVMAVILGMAQTATSAFDIGLLMLKTALFAFTFWTLWLIRQFCRGLPKRPPDASKHMPALEQPFL